MTQTTVPKEQLQPNRYPYILALDVGTSSVRALLLSTGMGRSWKTRCTSRRRRATMGGCERRRSRSVALGRTGRLGRAGRRMGTFVVICTRCDRGQRYCSDRCAQVRRRQSVREAGRRYQQTPLGARNNAVRQKRWRVKSATTVTHHTSPAHTDRREGPPGETVTKEADDAPSNRRPVRTRLAGPGPRCDFCGRPCGTYARWGTLGAERRRGWNVTRRW